MNGARTSMKLRIGRRVYNTDTANMLVFRRESNYVEILFQKRNGEYFICGNGGSGSPYATTGQKITVLSEEEAHKWENQIKL